MASAGEIDLITDYYRGLHSITAIKLLNQYGFGCPAVADSAVPGSRRLDLIYNPLGPSLPPQQSQLEEAYRKRLWEDHAITFNSLFALTNMPIKQFADTLLQTGEYVPYMELLANSFNIDTVDGLMCRSTVNVAWDGRIYDCDFNAALGMGTLERSKSIGIWDVG